MSRLIDADALIKDLEESHKAHSNNSREESLFRRDLRIIMERPTAFDVDAVMTELKEKKDEASIEAGKRSVRVGEDEYEDDPYYVGKKHAYGHAIELLRKGGVICRNL